jgi:hypothetical protein
MELVNSEFENFSPYEREVLEDMEKIVKKYAKHSAVR